MPRTDNHGLLNVRRYASHDHSLQRAKGLLAAHSEHRHRELCLFEDFVVLRILGKGGELRKASPHSSRLSISRREKVSGGFVGLAGIACKVIPYAVKIDSLWLHLPDFLSQCGVGQAFLQSFWQLPVRAWSAGHKQGGKQ